MNNNSTGIAADLVMPLESAEFVMQNAKSVQVVSSGIENLAKKVIIAIAINLH